MILYDETGTPVGIGAVDVETIERARAASWHDGYRVGIAAGRQDMHGDWLVGLIVVACLLVIAAGLLRG